jgi:hypothetical protein
MSSVELLARARGRDWSFAAWPLMAAGLGLCIVAMIAALILQTEPMAGRIWLVTLGLVSGGTGLAIRLNTAGAVLDRWLGPSRRLLLVGLAGLFLLLVLAAITGLVVSFLDAPWAPYHTGIGVNICLVVVPLGLATAYRALRIASQGRVITAQEESALMLFLAALCCGCAGWALYVPDDPLSWDTIRMALRVFTVVALVASALALASVRVRRWTVSVLIVLHFGGIASASLSPAPSPWVVAQAWTRLFRPYLEFMYLNNAYHFYAPEPGPPTYFWCRLIYKNDAGDEKGTWYKVPKIDDRTGQQKHTVALEYTRHLAMIENVVHTESVSLYDFRGNPMRFFLERQYATMPVPPIGVKPSKLVVPYHPLIPVQQQYGRPTDQARRLISSYVRHVALVNAEPPPELAGYQLYRIKAYRVRHDIPMVDLYAKSDPPIAANHPGLYRPFYMGTFDPKGELQDGKYQDGNLVVQTDPLLYWMVPVLLRENNLVVYDYCRLHAGDPNWIRLPDSQEWVTQERAQRLINRDEIPAPPATPRQKVTDE